MTKPLLIGFLALTAAFWVTQAGAQSRQACTAQCEGKRAGETANKSKMAACVRKCMNAKGNNAKAGKKQKYE